MATCVSRYSGCNERQMLYSDVQHLCNRVASPKTTKMLLCKLSTTCGFSAVSSFAAKVLESGVNVWNYVTWDPN